MEASSDPASETEFVPPAPAPEDGLPDIRPVILRILYEATCRNSELHPAWLQPGPRIREHCGPEVECLPHELGVPGAATEEHIEKCHEIQFGVYWVASKLRRGPPDEALCAQQSLLMKARTEWNAWMKGAIDRDEYQDRVDVLLLDESDRIKGGDAFKDLVCWKLADRDAADIIKSAYEDNGRIVEPDFLKKNEMKQMVNYGVKAASVLGELTEGKQRAKEKAMSFGGEASTLWRAFSRGVIEKEICVEAINTMFKSTSAAAGALNLSEEVKMEVKAAYPEMGPPVILSNPQPMDIGEGGKQ